MPRRRDATPARGTANTPKSMSVKSGRVTVKIRTQDASSKEKIVKSDAVIKNSSTEKPKKTPRIRVIGAEPLSKNWVDHGTPTITPVKNIIKITPQKFKIVSNQENSGNAREINTFSFPTAENGQESDIESERDQMTLDSDSDADQGEMAMRNNSTKAADQVHNTVAKWGKGTECIIEWGFRQNSESYKSKGTVVGRTARKGNVKIKVSYVPALGNQGPSGVLYLPQSDKIKIYSLRATKLLQVETAIKNLEEESENVSSDDSGCDLDPLPDLPNIEPSFAVHVVAIFRAIIRGYATVELDSEKAAIWHKFMNAPRDLLQCGMHCLSGIATVELPTWNCHCLKVAAV